MKKNTLAIVLILVTVGTGFAQKIKYKDLFPTLNAKNWEQGAPQLRAFLADPKNADAPNANLQVGLMMEDRFNKLDAAKDTVALFSAGDSAVFFLEKAKSLITEKELKKNDEFYQSFFRRDLRTGQFGIKVSDVHLDIEKKVEIIEQRMSNARDLNKKVKAVEEGNLDVQEKYKQLSSKYNDYNNLLLGADADAITLLQEIKSDGSEVMRLAKDVKSTATSLGTEKYAGEIVVKKIEIFGTDGTAGSALSSGTLELWDYEDWANTTSSEINGSVGILKSMASNYSSTIRGKKAQVKKSIDVEVDTLSQELLALFAKYDPESVVKSLLEVEASEVRIMKMIDLSINEALQDSSLVGAQLEIFQRASAEAEIMNSTVQSIIVEDLAEAKKFYPDYIDSFFQKYGTASKYVADMKIWAGRQRGLMASAAEYWKERNRWGLVWVEGEPERKIPLFEQDAPETEFYTIGIPFSSNEEVVVYGANLSSKMGYIYGFDEGRRSKWSLEYELPGTANFQLSSDTVPVAGGSVGFYVLNASVEENNLALVSFNQAGVLNWSTVVTTPKPPVDFKFDEITQELTVLLYPEEDLPLDNGELGYLVIDRTGNAR
ncbi:MAG: hypothetical protein ABJG78_15735 [Cyclobacteriaceae bacterium]